MSFRTQIIPVVGVARNAAALHKLVSASCASGDATVHALHATIDFAAALCDAGIPIGTSFGLIKETKDYGNTSVSMGLSALADLRPGEIKSWINAGTGAPKFQAYSRTVAGSIVVYSEDKPEMPSIQTAIAATEDQTRELQGLIAAALVAHRAKLEASAKEAGLTLHPVIGAFVTGTERGKWDKGTPEQRAELDNKMRALFDGVKVPGATLEPWGPPAYNAEGSYFLPQGEEGKFEYIACATMYRNLADEKQIDSDARLVGSFGIGRGSCQWAVSGPHDNITTFGFGFGMDRVDKLPEMPGALVKQAGDHGLGEILRGPCPVIALKSGALLALEANAQLKDTFMTTAAGEPAAEAPAAETPAAEAPAAVAPAVA